MSCSLVTSQTGQTRRMDGKQCAYSAVSCVDRGTVIIAQVRTVYIVCIKYTTDKDGQLLYIVVQKSQMMSVANTQENQHFL